jgi:hypothetical protein
MRHGRRKDDPTTTARKAYEVLNRRVTEQRQVLIDLTGMLAER